MARRDNRFRIIRIGEHKYEVWQRAVMLRIFHRWVRIATTDGYEHALGIAYAEVAKLGKPCIIDYIDIHQ